jgi:predicted amidophosphoribosyltransferase
MAPACASCAQLLEAPAAGPVCEACWRSIRPFTPPWCDACGDPLPPIRRTPDRSDAGRTPCDQPAPPVRCPSCRRLPGQVSRARAIGPYERHLRDIIHAFKYEGRRSLATRLGALMRAHGSDVLAGADLAVPVPLHWRRRHARGFNQAELLARELGLPVRQLLRRRFHTRPQIELPAGARHTNVAGAFALTWRCRLPETGDGAGFRLARRWLRQGNPPRPRFPRIDGKVIVLVDDVSTTGATLEACARVLLAAGAAEVRALTAARVVSPRR